jgi:hypothetical protein
LLEALKTVAGQTSLNMRKELLEALRTVGGQTSLNMPKELLEALFKKLLWHI